DLAYHILHALRIRVNANERSRLEPWFDWAKAGRDRPGKCAKYVIVLVDRSAQDLDKGEGSIGIVDIPSSECDGTRRRTIRRWIEICNSFGRSQARVQGVGAWQMNSGRCYRSATGEHEDQGKQLEPDQSAISSGFRMNVAEKVVR